MLQTLEQPLPAAAQLGEATRDQGEEEAEEEGIHQPYPQGVSHGAAPVAQQGKTPSPAAPGEQSPAEPDLAAGAGTGTKSSGSSKLSQHPAKMHFRGLLAIPTYFWVILLPAKMG